MSYIGDLGSYIQTNGANKDAKVQTSNSNNIGLDMTSFLKIMLAQFQNQSIDDTADTSEMLNQMVQMQMIQALVNMTDATLMSYSASLVGKEVTIATYDDKGQLHEVVGTVTATGSYGGQQVIFVNDTYYYMNQIMAVGRLPEKNDGSDPDQTPGDSGDNEGTPPVTEPEKAI